MMDCVVAGHRRNCHPAGGKTLLLNCPEPPLPPSGEADLHHRHTTPLPLACRHWSPPRCPGRAARRGTDRPSRVTRLGRETGKGLGHEPVARRDCARFLPHVRPLGSKKDTRRCWYCPGKKTKASSSTTTSPSRWSRSVAT